MSSPSSESTSSPPNGPALSPWRARLHEIIFEADTRAGKWFDSVLIVAILLSVVVVMLASVPRINARYGTWLYAAEWFFTLLFTVEYAIRMMCVVRPVRYARSFFGVVDLLSFLPTYLSLIIPGAESLLVVRSLRLLRIFRVFKLGRMLSEAGALRDALLASRAKVLVFIMTVLILTTIMGALMYVVEGTSNAGFDSIPQSVYWAIVTMTTVGYGDATPLTPLGKILAAIMMIMGYSLIIVPTGIVSAELALSHGKRRIARQSCPNCLAEDHEADATFCKHCGTKL